MEETQDARNSPRSEAYSPSHEAMPDEELASAVASIMDRIGDSAFPAVLPKDQSAVSLEAATDLLTWVQKTDSVQIQSYISEQWKLYRQNNSFIDTTKSERVLHAEWARNYYYVHLRQFQQSRCPGETVYDSLCSLLDGASLAEATQTSLRQLCSKVEVSKVEELRCHFMGAFFNPTLGVFYPLTSCSVSKGGLGSFWGHSRSFWNLSGVILGLFWGHSKIILWVLRRKMLHNDVNATLI